MKLHALVFVAIFLTACTTPALTGQSSLDTNTTNTTANEQDGEKKEEPELIKEKTCEEQLQELEKEKEQHQYKLLKIKGEHQKTSLELQYKKDSHEHEEETQQLLANLKSLSEQQKNLNSDIDSIKRAIRILEEKCGLKH